MNKSCVAACLESVRMAVESVSGCSWNECPDQRGITVRMRVEWVSESAWNPHAVYDPGKGTGVWVIAGTPTKVTWRPVEVLSLADDSARVSGDLKVGEQIVALGAHLLQDGEQVRLASQSDVSAAGSRP